MRKCIWDDFFDGNLSDIRGEQLRQDREPTPNLQDVPARTRASLIASGYGAGSKTLQSIRDDQRLREATDRALALL